MSAAIHFQKLGLKRWRQFDEVDLDLHPRLTIITGANGSGKSTLLYIFSRHFGWDRPYLSTPHIDKEGKITYLPGFLRRLIQSYTRPNPKALQVGFLLYSNGAQSTLSVPESVGSSYSLDVSAQQEVAGVHIFRIGYFRGISLSPVYRRR